MQRYKFGILVLELTQDIFIIYKQELCTALFLRHWKAARSPKQQHQFCELKNNSFSITFVIYPRTRNV